MQFCVKTGQMPGGVMIGISSSIWSHNFITDGDVTGAAQGVAVYKQGASALEALERWRLTCDGVMSLKAWACQ